MRLHRFYINKTIDSEKVLIDEERLIHQWRNVFRFNVGGEIILFDGSGFEFDAVIENINNKEAVCVIVDKRKGIIGGGSPSAGSGQDIVLYQSMIKKDKMEWVVEKATELGVSKIVPIISERSEKKGFNLERAKKIAIEASEQCGRADVPEASSVVSLSEVLNSCENPVVFDACGERLEVLGKSLEREEESKSKTFKLEPLSLFIGPEGGWTEKELEMFRKVNSKIFSLGKLTLRAETASIIALYNIMYN